MTVLNAVIDISHYNGDSLDFSQAAGAGILGVIHKASEGLTYRDPMYAANRQAATAAGMMWGAYHFGTGDDPAQQAENFLASIGDPGGVLLALDFEPNGSGATMTLDQASSFTTAVQAATGQWPGLYSGSLIKQLLGSSPDPVLANSWFWLAEYGDEAVVPPNWPIWTMWQYTDGTNGPEPHSVDGIGNCDRDKFNGDEDQLRRLWGVG